MMHLYARRLVMFAKKPEGFFVVVAAIFGSLFALLIPPFQTPDEDLHLYRAYEVAAFKVPHKISDGRVGSELPESIALTRERINAGNGQNRFTASQKYSHKTTKSALLDIPLQKEKTVFYNTSSSPPYMPIMYTPQAIIVWIANLFNSPVVLTMYLIRFILLILWSSCIYLAIKLIPIRKWTIAAISLLPAMLAQSVSPGLDVLTYVSILLFLVVTVKLYLDNAFKLETKWVPILVLLATIMIFGKSTAAAIPLLICLVPAKKIVGQHALLLKLIVVCLPLVLYGLWVVLSSSIAAGGDAGQMQLFKDNPFIFIVALLNTIFLTSPEGVVLQQSIIGNFGWLDTPVAPLVIAAGFCYIAILLSSGYENVKLSINQNSLLLAVGLIYTVGVFLAMFLYITPAGSQFIAGIQGRYVIPLFYVLALVTWMSLSRTEVKKYSRFIAIGGIALILVSTLTIFQRYYIY